MKTWKIYVTFFQKIFDKHYTVDPTFNGDNFVFAKVNDDYEWDKSENQINYNVFFEHQFPSFEPIWQQKGYHENSVLYHLYKDKMYDKLDYIGFLEYDHVLRPGFCAEIQERIEQSKEDLIFSFGAFSYEQLWNQGIMLNKWRPSQQEGRANSRWNCLNVILKDYNDFYGTNFSLDDLRQKDCLPLCHAVLMPVHIYDKIMAFHTFIMESGRIEKFHTFNWRSNAGIMERYLAVELSLESAPIVTDILLEHRSCDIKVVKPEWSEKSLFKQLRYKILGY